MTDQGKTDEDPVASGDHAFPDSSPGLVWTIVVAAGRGSRMGGDVPKQLLPLGDRRVLDWSLAVAATVSDGVVLVGPPGEQRYVAGPDFEGVPLVLTEGGEERTDSVRAGLAVLPSGVEVVCVHDGARPLASPVLYQRVVAAVRDGADAAVPAVAVTDTIKRVRSDGSVVQTLPRNELRAAQTPQAFTLAALRSAHTAGGSATDDAALVEAAGGRVVVVEGDPANLKVTRPGDLSRLEALLAEHSPLPGEPSVGTNGAELR